MKRGHGTMMYGCVLSDDIAYRNIAKVEVLLSRAPKFFGELKEKLKRFGMSHPTVDNYLCANGDGLVGLMENVITEAEDVRFESSYLSEPGEGCLYNVIDFYPEEERSENEKKIKTKKDVEKLMSKYISILVDKSAEICFLYANEWGL